MSRGSNSSEAAKRRGTNIIRKYKFLLSERKTLTRETGISYAALTHPEFKAYARSQYEKMHLKLTRSADEF
jgi:hypothetical protein